MVKVEFDMRKSVPENAKNHYERAKKLKAKIPGLRHAIEESRKKLETQGSEPAGEKALKRKVERKWYEKFRWFTSSQGYLVLGGRDATTNEVLVKKHLEPNDVVLHASIQGAPFFIVKNPGGGEVPSETKKEAAVAAASYSKIWSRGAGSADVYEVRPDQVSKTPPAGEYLSKGAFMIYGEKKWHKGVEVKVAVGVREGGVIGGPVAAVAAQTKDYVVVGVGDIPQGALAKKIREKLTGAELDDLQRFLPPGGGRLLL